MSIPGTSKQSKRFYLKGTKRGGMEGGEGRGFQGYFSYTVILHSPGPSQQTLRNPGCFQLQSEEEKTNKQTKRMAEIEVISAAAKSPMKHNYDYLTVLVLYLFHLFQLAHIYLHLIEKV